MGSSAAPGAIAVLVLAAGEGARFGGAKQLARVGGRPLLGRVLNAAAALAGPRVVVLGARGDLIEPLVPAGWRAVHAPGWRAGPGASLRAGLAALPAAEAVAIVLGDLAWLDPEALRRVAAAAAAAPDAAAVRAFDGEQPGHPLLIRGELLAAAREAPDVGLRPLLAARPVLRVPCPGLGVAVDVDRVGDVPLN